MTNKVTAPFTHEQILSINKYQASGIMHPFTCSVCRDAYGTGDHDSDNLYAHDEYALVATFEGFICPTCDYTQDWCHEFMADMSWSTLGFRFQTLTNATKEERLLRAMTDVVAGALLDSSVAPGNRMHDWYVKNRLATILEIIESDD